MKPQDIILLLLFVGLLIKNNKTWTTIAGIVLIIISMPLFAKYVFFTAEHLVYFACLYFLLAVIQVTMRLYANRH